MSYKIFEKIITKCNIFTALFINKDKIIKALTPVIVGQTAIKRLMIGTIVYFKIWLNLS